MIIIGMLCMGQETHAQTFLDRLQTKKAYWGTVTVRQSEAIAALVDEGSEIVEREKSKVESKELEIGSDNPNTATGHVPPRTTNSGNVLNGITSTREEGSNEDSGEEYVPSKKIMVNSYKTDGYRVQAYAGGNTKKDKTTAESMGSKIKQLLPDQPVYVHFNSPRWICRVGNFRSYEEAHQIMVFLREQGFKQATIVKGKITVPY